MERGTLATLDRAVQESISIELGDKTEEAALLDELGVEPKRTRVIAGVRVLRNASRDADVDDTSAKMIDRMLRFQADRTIILGKLRRVGVEPHAVIPVSAWNRICDEARLYRFSPRGDTVRIAGEAMIKRAEDTVISYKKEDFQGSLGLGIGVLIIVGLLATVMGFFASSYFFWGTAAAVFGVLFCVIRLGSGPSIDPSDRARHLKEIVETHSKNGTLYQQLWPKFAEPESKTTIRIELPMPPVEVQERIIAIERTRHPLCVAVAAKGIVLKQSVAEILLGNQVDQAYEAPQSPNHEADPIAYIVEGSAVAIIDQYGDLPIELTTIQKVVNSDHLV